jgi:predicted glycoside hydrolase/deacetylase ChbG (UPF0249 family)
MSTPIITANSGEFDKKTSKIVIFNSDDFGLSASSNGGVIACHERGIVHSTSLMATGPAFAAAAAYASAHPSLDTGLHLALCEVAPACDSAEIPTLVTPCGSFHPDFGSFLRHYLTGRISAAEIEKEFRAQLNIVLNAGLAITHLDSHQHLHALPAIFAIVVRLAVEYRIPAVRTPDERSASILRNLLQGRAGRTLQRIALSASTRTGRRALASTRVATPDHFAGFMDMGRWSEPSLRARILSLPPGLTEICCHPRCEPGTDPACDFQAEMEALASDGLRQFLAREKVEVTTFREYFTNPAPPASPALE